MERIVSTNEISELLEIGNDLIDMVGDCSNLERKVNSKSILWKTVIQRGGLTLQKDCLTNKARIVDERGIQKANGSILTMREKMDRMLSDDFLKAGDVIGVSRGAYEHYAIYAGSGKVIHYAGETSDFNGKVSIHEAPFEEFLKGNSEYFVISFEGKYQVPIQWYFG